MSKQKRKMLSVLLCLSVLLLFYWKWLLMDHFPVTWMSYLGLLFFLPIPYLYVKNIKKMIVYTAAYLAAGAFNLLTFVTPLATLTIIGGVLSIQISEFLLLIIYLSLFFSSLKKISKGTWEPS